MEKWDFIIGSRCVQLHEINATIQFLISHFYAAAVVTDFAHFHKAKRSGGQKKERRNNLVYIYLAEINYIHQSHEKWQCPHFYYPANIHIHSSRLTRATHTKYRIMYWKSVEGKMLVYSNSVEHYRNT